MSSNQNPRQEAEGEIGGDIPDQPVPEEVEGGEGQGIEAAPDVADDDQEENQHLEAAENLEDFMEELQNDYMWENDDDDDENDNVFPNLTGNQNYLDPFFDDEYQRQIIDWMLIDASFYDYWENQ